VTYTRKGNSNGTDNPGHVRGAPSDMVRVGVVGSTAGCRAGDEARVHLGGEGAASNRAQGRC
jgi:hypothetical protein